MTSKIQNAINETICQYVFTTLSMSNFAKWSKSVVESYTFTNLKWNAFEFEFFDLHYDDRLINNKQIVNHAEKNIYFRDVHLFIKRTKNITTI